MLNEVGDGDERDNGSKRGKGVYDYNVDDLFSDDKEDEEDEE